MIIPDKFTKNFPLLCLVAANAVPLYGVAFAGWDAFLVVLLYWAENLIIGFYNILKIAFAKVNKPQENLGKLFLIPFFWFITSASAPDTAFSFLSFSAKNRKCFQVAARTCLVFSFLLNFCSM